MKTFARNLANLGRTVAVAVILMVSLVPSAHALAPGEAIALSGGSGLTGQFNHSYGFSLSAPAGIDYFSSRINFPTSFSIAGFAATLFSGTTAIISGIDGAQTGALVPNSFFLGLLRPGTYRLDIGGFAVGTSGLDSYSGMLRAVPAIAPIPEPEIWAMMLIGVGLVVIRLRQKSRLASARHFS